MKSIFYRYPLLYDLGMIFIYFDGLKILKDIVGRGKSVFEPGCGYGRMKKYLYPDCSYSGVDLNETFIEYGKKRNRDIDIGDALDERWYRESDTILLCDIIHHLNGQKHDLVSAAVKFAREKVVIIEPWFVDVAAKRNVFSRVIGKFMAVMDADGFNEIDQWLSKDEYMDLFRSIKELHHIKKMKMWDFRNHIFVEMCV
jgi:SAM-dependent methyltransferase